MQRWLLLLIVLALGGLGTWSAPGQETVGGVIHSRYRTFRIPFNVGAGAAQIRQVQLYVSLDQGQSWQAAANAPPDQKFFRFVAERDGLHWFAVQTLDLDNRVNPANMQGAAPSLKVIVDTAAPGVQLQTLAPQGDKVGVSWEIRDENLEFLANDTVRLDYRAVGGQNWLPLNMPLGATQLYWLPQAPGPVEVRLQARDRAGNTAQTTATIGLAGNAAPGNPAAGNAPQNNAGPVALGGAQDLVNGPAEHERKLVNSKRVSLNYELKDVGPSGVSVVELWYTVNGRSWNKYPHRFDDPKQTAIAFDVEGEGTYGISLCAKSGVGLGERAPQSGDRPQLWIEVDLTKPAVQIQSVVVGNGEDKGKLFVNWTARDKNLHREPITLSYAEQPTGPWKTFAEKLSNAAGRHVWTMPASGVPYQFHIKVEAVDQAGNVGEAITDNLVKVDLSTPRVKILTVEPGR